MKCRCQQVCVPLGRLGKNPFLSSFRLLANSIYGYRTEILSGCQLASALSSRDLIPAFACGPYLRASKKHSSSPSHSRNLTSSSALSWEKALLLKARLTSLGSPTSRDFGSAILRGLLLFTTASSCSG